MSGGREHWVRLRVWARALKADTFALALACRDPRVPWPAKLVAGIVVAYALSPIDLIPDFIPVLGYADDLLLVPLGIALAVKLVPDEVLRELRAEAHLRLQEERPSSRLGAAIVVGIWIAAAVWVWRLL